MRRRLLPPILNRRRNARLAQHCAARVVCGQGISFLNRRIQGDETMRKLLLAVMIAAPLLASACNTIEGIGKDVQAAGKAVSDTADETK